MKKKCRECEDIIEYDIPMRCRMMKLCPQCYDEIINGKIRPACFTIGQNPCGNGMGDDMSFDIAVKNYEADDEQA